MNKWDMRFLGLAEYVSQWSKDPSTKTGAVIVRPNKSIASVGYNGFPRGMRDDSVLYENREVKYSRIVHCEMNALLACQEPVTGYTLYTWPFGSCDRCFVHMIQAGITRFVYPKLPYSLEGRWGDSLEKVKQYADEAGVILDEVDLPSG